jgi:hypothetical protein
MNYNLKPLYDIMYNYKDLRDRYFQAYLDTKDQQHEETRQYYQHKFATVRECIHVLGGYICKDFDI